MTQVEAQVSGMNDARNLNSVVDRDVAATTRDMITRNPILALWRTMIGKKVVMAVTGVVFFGFVIVPKVSNLQIFSCPNQNNTYFPVFRGTGFSLLNHRQLISLVPLLLFV